MKHMCFRLNVMTSSALKTLDSPIVCVVSRYSPFGTRDVGDCTGHSDKAGAVQFSKECAEQQASSEAEFRKIADTLRVQQEVVGGNGDKVLTGLGAEMWRISGFIA